MSRRDRVPERIGPLSNFMIISTKAVFSLQKEPIWKTRPTILKFRFTRAEGLYGNTA